MEWNLENAACWEHLLPGEPTELRKECPVTDDIDPLTREEELSKEKHLDMPITWVKQLHIGNPGKKNVSLPPPPIFLYGYIFSLFKILKNAIQMVKKLFILCVPFMNDSLHIIKRVEWYLVLLHTPHWTIKRH